MERIYEGKLTRRIYRAGVNGVKGRAYLKIDTLKAKNLSSRNARIFGRVQGELVIERNRERLGKRERYRGVNVLIM